MSNSIIKILALDKVATVLSMIRQNGGVFGSLYKLYRQEELKDGKLVGEDSFGNKYYENPRYFYSRNRWVEYSDKFNMNYDASQVPAEWYGWLHYKTDLLPHQDPGRPKYKWMAEHTENLSGTTGQYVPYSTTRPKVEAWMPKPKTSV
ncbi:probable NADH dehydrogenase [ubiquinone] 1 alpha subcomplex subunit 12 [Bicyclus anynana]|uniref:NADH dehydrogenase [ubiquinone] 1 alpha subcomplex subunit 12 n=1 Tax=Bicyclus anynana TaxID=110368 RepID=A0A6J1NX79_BICAN|nr:probable NADH dehydrogenase [ubiquinone] 1 alpha subcomplex subunit 12 [Bicyclus anynana]